MMLTLIFFLILATAVLASLIIKSEWRKRFLVSNLYRFVKASFPAMSQTEKEAIDAGDVWWEAEFFTGQPNWKKLLSYKTPVLSEREQSFLAKQVPHLCRMIDHWAITHQLHDLPAEVWTYLKTEKFFGLMIPEAYGGLGFSPFAHSSIIMALATHSSTCAITAMVPNSLGPAELILKYGTDEQKNYYLPRLAVGDDIPCFGLTSLDAGSDASSMTDYGVVCRGEFEGKDVIGIKLNWNKRYITLAPIATVLGLAFRLYDPDRLIGEEVDLGISVCLIPRSLVGVQQGHRHWPLMLTFMNGPSRGKDVFVPLNYLIGGQSMVGQGWRMLVECLSEGRGISLPALSAAGGKLLYGLTGAYSRIRQQFHLPIAKFEGIRAGLAEIAGKAFMLQAMRIFTVGPVQEGLSPAIASAIAKCYMTEMARDIVMLAMDIHGGKAIQVGPNNYMLSSYLDTPVGITVEGANILMRNLVIFGQGSVRCHPYLLQELHILSDEDSDTLDKFDTVLCQHVKFSLQNVVRSLLYSFSGSFAALTDAPKPIKKYTRELTRMSAAFALLTDVSLLTLGGALKRKEALSARLADILSYLHIASSVIKYYADATFSEHHRAYVAWSVEYCLWKVQVAMQQFFENFPHRYLAKVLKVFLFPFGYPYHRPNDRLDNDLVEAMLHDSNMRKELLRDCVLDPVLSNPKYVTEKAFHEAIRLEDLFKRWSKIAVHDLVPEYRSYGEKVNAAVVSGRLSPEEGKELIAYDALRRRVLEVDEFSADLSKVLTPVTANGQK